MTLLITDGMPRGLGYLELDHRATEPPPGMARHAEFDTYTCSHCQAVVALNPVRVRERYKCKRCMHHVCDNCAATMAMTGECQSFARLVEQVLEREHRHPSIILP